jgi:hypothetical protein
MDRPTKRLLTLSTLVLLALTLPSAQPVNAQTENITISCSVTVTDILEGQPVPVSLQIYPAPPTGEVFTNISVTIVSPLQGIWGNGGNGPWSKGGISTDLDGVASVNFDIVTFEGYWIADVHFGGQYFADGTVYYQPCAKQINFHVFTPETIPPSPPPNTPLGPVEIISKGDGSNHIEIVSPNNNTATSNPVYLVFSATASLIPYCYSYPGNVGYSLDGGPIYSVNDFVNKTIAYQAGSDIATMWVNLTLPLLLEGSHNVVAYWGWYWAGVNQRYEVWSYAAANFTVADSTVSVPTPTVPEFSSAIPLVATLAAAGLLVLISRGKHAAIKR